VSSHRHPLGAGTIVVLLLAASLAVVFASPQDAPPGQVPFAAWLDTLRADALSRGISQKTVDDALGNIAVLPVVVDRDRTQAELTLSIDQYLKRRLPKAFVKTARATVARERTLLKAVSARYGVPAPIIASIWGLESNFGRFSGVRPTIPALATLAYEGRRAAMFRDELFAALTILDRGDVTADRLKGSWAGALGQPQFMPSTFLKDAVDFDGDGRRDIWASTPDVLASIANYLKARGWVEGQRWGREVRLRGKAAERVAAAVPLRMTGPCRAVREMTETRPLSAWSRLGVTLASGARLPAGETTASLVRVDRRTFLVYANYEAILAYNCAHTYALSVVLLAEKIG
jgi:membrane-bound lytic murein transglycosylase B